MVEMHLFPAKCNSQSRRYEAGFCDKPANEVCRLSDGVKL